LDKAARAALARVRQTQGRGRKPPKTPAPKPESESNGQEGPVLKTVRSFVWTWTEMANWANEYDPAQIAEALTEEQYQRFVKTMADADRFTAELAHCRQQRSAVV
jgi:hypothetical protein